MFSIDVVIDNLQKVGFGALLFAMAYVANICLGIWKNVKINEYSFNWAKLAESGVKFLVLVAGIGLLSVVVSIMPQYITYVGVDIPDDTLDVVDSVVIVSAFIVASCQYIKDGYDKLKIILGG